MENWKISVKSNPQEVIKKLENVLLSTGGFIFNIGEDLNSFKIHKPVLYPDQILHRNRIIVKGNIATTNTINQDEAEVELSFTQDFYMRMTVLSIIIFGGILFLLISKISYGIIMYSLGSTVLIAGIALWLALQRKLERDAQKYKTLISEILEIN